MLLRVEVFPVAVKRTQVRLVLFVFCDTYKILPERVYGRLESSFEEIHVEVEHKYSLIEHKSEICNWGWAL